MKKINTINYSDHSFKKGVESDTHVTPFHAATPNGVATSPAVTNSPAANKIESIVHKVIVDGSTVPYIGDTIGDSPNCFVCKLNELIVRLFSLEQN